MPVLPNTAAAQQAKLDNGTDTGIVKESFDELQNSDVAQAIHNQQLDPLHALAPDPVQWSEDDLRSWCRHKGIPQWGSISGLIARVNRFREEEKNVKVGIAGRPKPPIGRTDRTGTETYYFSAVLRHSSLDALKSSLFIAGNFPSDTELDLWLIGHVLFCGHRAQQFTKEPIQIGRKERILKIQMHNTIIDNKLREVQRDPMKERQQDYTTKVEWHAGSVLNKVTDISKSALALQRIRNAPGTIAGQHFRKHDRARLIKGRNLADMVMDLEDLNTKREKMLQKPLQRWAKMQQQRNEAIEKTEKEASEEGYSYEVGGKEVYH
ncbi:hypothetical protein EYC84_001881 [Monilinia fructicola]|nr:hypothetical protein EYC84_001881 [Monilinia fructicola]